MERCFHNKAVLPLTLISSVSKGSLFRFRRTTIISKKTGVLKYDLQVPQNLGIPLSRCFQTKSLSFFIFILLPPPPRRSSLASQSPTNRRSVPLEHHCSKLGAGAPRRKAKCLLYSLPSCYLALKNSGTLLQPWVSTKSQWSTELCAVAFIKEQR